MSNKKTCLCVMVLIFLAACGKEKFDPIVDNTVKDPPQGGSCEYAEEYINADFNSSNICFSIIKNITDTFSNAYYIDKSIHLDHISLIRNDSDDKTMACQLHFINPDLHNKKLPYILPHGAIGYNEYAEITASNIDHAFGKNTNDDYIGNTYRGFSITITDTSGGYLKGTFKGDASTKKGSRVIISNGTFKVHVITVDKSK